MALLLTEYSPIRNGGIKNKDDFLSLFRMHIKTDTILNSVMEKNDIVHFFNLFKFTIYLTSFFLLADLFLYFVLFLEMFRKLAVIPGKVVVSR